MCCYEIIINLPCYKTWLLMMALTVKNGIVKHLRQVFQIIRPVIQISDILVLSTQGRIQDFFRRGCTRLLLYFNTNKPNNFFFFFFCRIPVVLENRSLSQEGGGAHPLHPPLRCAPATISTPGIVFQINTIFYWHY